MPNHNTKFSLWSTMDKSEEESLLLFWFLFFVFQMEDQSWEPVLRDAPLFFFCFLWEQPPWRHNRRVYSSSTVHTCKCGVRKCSDLPAMAGSQECRSEWCPGSPSPSPWHLSFSLSLMGWPSVRGVPTLRAVGSIFSCILEYLIHLFL